MIDALVTGICVIIGIVFIAVVLAGVFASLKDW